MAGCKGFYYTSVFEISGERVEASNVMGLSGNTGFSTKPHLHFVVIEAPGKSVLFVIVNLFV